MTPSRAALRVARQAYRIKDGPRTVEDLAALIDAAVAPLREALGNATHAFPCLKYRYDDETIAELGGVCSCGIDGALAAWEGE